MTHEPPRILLADDEDTFRIATARLFEQEGYRCDCAQDSEEASRLLTSQHDALVSDIRMPGNMQFEFLQDVRARFPLLPIVLVTGYPSVQTAVEALRLSFTDYLLKPVDWLELLRAVHRAVEKARYLRMTDVIRDETDRVGTSLDHVREVLSRAGTTANERGLAWSLNAFLSKASNRWRCWLKGYGLSWRPSQEVPLRSRRMSVLRCAVPGSRPIGRPWKVPSRYWNGPSLPSDPKTLASCGRKSSVYSRKEDDTGGIGFTRT